MTPKSHVGAIVFYVKDLDRSAKFYEQIGCTIVHRGKAEAYGDADFFMAKSGDLSLVFFQNPTPPGKSPIIVFTLADGGIDALTEHLASTGVTIVTPVSHAPGGWTSDFLDPDGHTLSYYQSAEKPR